MNALRRRFNVEEESYRELIKATEAKIVRWEYWNGFHWHWDPAEIKSHEYDAGPRYPSQRTAEEKAYYAYGYDIQNRVVLIRHGFPEEIRRGSSSAQDEMGEEFIRYSRDTLTCSKFFGGHLLEVADATIANGKVVRVEEVKLDSGWHTIEWRGEQVARIQFGMFGKKPCLEWCYDESGKLIGMFDLPRKVRLPKGVSFATLKNTIGKRLMEIIPKVVAKAKIDQPVYCLALAYDGEGNGVLPPVLGIGLESERRGWTKKDPKNAKSLIWNPVEFRHYETEKLSLPTDKKFEKSCQLFNDLLDRKGSDKPARTLLNKVARDLGKVQWNNSLHTTDDFVVFAVDFEGADLKENLMESVSAETLISLKRAKML